MEQKACILRTRAVSIITGIGVGLLFFPAMSMTFTALEIIHAALNGL